MPAPNLTPMQKMAFEKSFNEIIAKASPEIKNLWTGNIVWVGNLPHFPDNVHSKLKGKLADEYVILHNKLMGRTI